MFSRRNLILLLRATCAHILKFPPHVFKLFKVCSQFESKNLDFYNFTVGTIPPEQQGYDLESIIKSSGMDFDNSSTSELITVVVFVAIFALAAALFGFLASCPMNFSAMRISYDLRIRFVFVLGQTFIIIIIFFFTANSTSKQNIKTNP